MSIATQAQWSLTHFRFREFLNLQSLVKSIHQLLGSLIIHYLQKQFCQVKLITANVEVIVTLNKSSHF